MCMEEHMIQFLYENSFATEIYSKTEINLFENYKSNSFLCF